MIFEVIEAMTVKKAIKILGWWITNKKQSMKKLKNEWNYGKYDEMTGVAKTIFDMDRIILSNLENVRNELVTDCKHTKKMRDKDPNGQWYCMACNQDL